MKQFGMLPSKLSLLLQILLFLGLMGSNILAQSGQKVITENAEIVQVQSRNGISGAQPLFSPSCTIAKLEPNTHIFVTGKEGTKALVFAKDFVHQDGSPVKGPIEFRMTEVTKKAGLILGNLPTTSNGRLLVSGGVVKMEAFADGKPLKLAPSAGIDVQFPGGRESGMMLFKGVQDPKRGMNWVPSGASGPMFYFATSSTFDNKKYGRNWDWRYLFDQPQILKSISPNMEFGTVNPRKLTFGLNGKSVAAFLLQELKSKYSCVGVADLMVEVDFDPNGSPTLVSVTPADNPCFVMALQEIAARLSWESKAQYGMAIFPLQVRIESKVEESQNMFISAAENPDMVLDDSTKSAYLQFQQVVKQRLEEKKMQDFANAAMRVTSLDWINCDRFLNVKDVVSFKVEAKDAPVGTVAFLVFEEINAVIEGSRGSLGTFSFERMPKGMKAKVVTLAYDLEENAKLGILPIVIQSGPVLAVSIKSVSEADLRIQLDNL